MSITDFTRLQNNTRQLGLDLDGPPESAAIVQDQRAIAAIKRRSSIQGHLINTLITTLVVGCMVTSKAHEPAAAASTPSTTPAAAAQGGHASGK